MPEDTKSKDVPNLNQQSVRENKEKSMRILWINNDGAGFADYIEVAENTTVDKFFAKQLPGREPEDYLIRVNRQPVPRDYVIQPGDRVSMTPTKIEGAKLR